MVSTTHRQWLALLVVLVLAAVVVPAAVASAHAPPVAADAGAPPADVARPDRVADDGDAASTLSTGALVAGTAGNSFDGGAASTAGAGDVVVGATAGLVADATAWYSPGVSAAAAGFVLGSLVATVLLTEWNRIGRALGALRTVGARAPALVAAATPDSRPGGRGFAPFVVGTDPAPTSAGGSDPSVGGESRAVGVDSRAGGRPEEEFLPDEVRVRHLLEDEGGRMRQSAIVDATEWSKSKVSRLLTEMDEDGTITKVGLGRQNLICLSGQEPAIIRDSEF